MPDRTPPEDLDPAALKKLKRGELDEVAADAGVPDPEGLATKDEVIAAIPNPALAPEPPAPLAEREYEVIGPVAVHGHAHGEKFTALIQPPQEALLIEAGHIKRTLSED